MEVPFLLLPNATTQGLESELCKTIHLIKKLHHHA